MIQKIIVMISFLAFIGNAQAQKPETIYSFARIRKPIPYYKEQAIAWKKEVDKDPKNANAWYNYFRVSKNLANIDTTDKRTRTEKWDAIKLIVEKMGEEIPGSYEYNYVKFSYEGNNYDYLSYLKKADELSNGRTLHVDYMVNWGEIERNIERRDKYCKQLYESGDFSPGLMYYNYNVMVGAKPNAIIFTIGDNDTYPIWLLQSQGIRRDITALNLYLLNIDEYRNKVFKELGIEKWDMQMSKDNLDSNNDRAQKRFATEIIKHVAANKKNYPVYLALTAGSPEYLKPNEENLFLTGLAYEYSLESPDNMAIMKRNFEQLYALDYLEKPFYNDISKEITTEINCNYVVPMLKLYDHYKISGDTQRMEWMKQKLLFLTKGKPEEKEIKKHFESN